MGKIFDNEMGGASSTLDKTIRKQQRQSGRQKGSASLSTIFSAAQGLCATSKQLSRPPRRQSVSPDCHPWIPSLPLSQIGSCRVLSKKCRNALPDAPVSVILCFRLSGCCHRLPSGYLPGVYPEQWSSGSVDRGKSRAMEP